MDFASLDARGGAETPQRMTILHPLTGEPILHDGKPCIALVRGMHARSVQDVARAEARRQMQAAKSDDQEGFHENMVRFATMVIVGFENVIFDGKPATEADAGRFLDLFLTVPGAAKPGSFAQQVVTFANEVTHFLPETSAA